MIPTVRVFVTSLALAVIASGCASSSHRIPRAELYALSQQAPESRGARVRVIQGLGNSEDPPPAPHAEGNTQVVIVAPIWVDGTPHDHNHGSTAQPSGGGHGSHGGGGGPALAAGKKQDAKNLLVVAAIVAGALVFTEGTRYDGWVKLHPMHPVHLYGPSGEYTWMPLAHVTPEVASWASRAVVRDVEGPWTPLGRAPLDRKGFTYSLLMGSGQIALIGDEPRAGFMSHIQIGFFPTQVVGLQLDLGNGWADDATGATVFDGRYGLELDVLPLSAGILHAGGFGEIGVSYRSDDGIQFDDQDNFISFGALAQLELTTRLALSLRAGLSHLYGETLSEATVGVTIY